jgi:hypothetical protein
MQRTGQWLVRLQLRCLLLTGQKLEPEQLLSQLGPVHVALDAVRSEAVALDAVRSEAVALDAVRSEAVALDTVRSGAVALDTVRS